MLERQPNRPPIPDANQAPQEGANGVPGIPATLNERAQPPPEKSALNRAVERTRNLYQRNGWVFLPLGEAGKDSPTLPSRLPTTIFSAPSHDHLIEETKKPDITQTPLEVGEDSPKVPQPQSEPKKPMTPADVAMLDESMRWLFSLPEKERNEVFERVMKEARERMSESELFFERLRMEEKIRSMLPDQDPDVAEVFRRTFGPPDRPTPSPEDLQGMFDLPSPDELPSDTEL